MSTELPKQNRKMEFLASAQAEVNDIVAKNRLMTAITTDVTPVAQRLYKVRDMVLVYSEKENKWLGPLIVADVTGRMITV